MIRRYTRPVRKAFTLVELMVAMGLSVLIMYIMAERSRSARRRQHRRSSGQMSTQLQGAGAIMTRDILYSDHFLRDDTRPGGGVKLSQYRFDLLPSQQVLPPKAGFFRIISPTSIESQTAAQEVNGFAINSAVNHALHFTSILPASDQNQFSVTVPAANGIPYRSRAAEISYFLVASGAKTSPGTSGQILYSLMRRQRLLALTADERSSLVVNDADVIASNGTNTVYTVEDLTDPNGNKRFPLTPNTLPQPVNSLLALQNARFGEDLLLSNVLSFEVLVDWSPATSIAGTNLSPRLQTAAPPNWEHPFDNLSVNGGKNPNFNNQGVFDSWSAFPAQSGALKAWNDFSAGNTRAIPLAIRVKQIQATVRIWDSKTKLARQNTWKFSM